MKVAQFLRVKKVPLHLRSLVPLIILSHPIETSNSYDSGPFSSTSTILPTEIISVPPYVVKRYMGETVVTDPVSVNSIATSQDVNNETSQNINNEKEIEDLGVSFQITISNRIT